MLAKDIKNGSVVNYQDAPVMIESVSVQTPSARGAATLAYVGLSPVASTSCPPCSRLDGSSRRS